MNHYSQNDEQEFILSFFGERKGRLLDIGAFDGVTFSNSRALLERGWYGVLVEPDARNFSKLLSNSTGLDVDLVNAAVSDAQDGLFRLHMDLTPDRGWASTIVNEACGGVLKELPVKVWTITTDPEMLWGFWGGEFDKKEPFNFISLDAEWMDFDILKAFPKAMLSACELLCIEPRNIAEREQMRAWLDDAGFRTAHETPENLMVSREV